MAKERRLTTAPGRGATASAGGMALAGSRGFSLSKAVTRLIFVGPALVMIGFFVVYPTLATIYRSFFQSVGISFNPPLTFVGLNNYATFFQDDSIHTAIINNILWLVIVTPVVVALGVLCAVLFDRVRYEVIAKSIVFIPLAISATASGVIWRLMYADDPNTGTVNAILQRIIPNFQPISFLGQTGFVNFALFAAQVWASLGFGMVLLSAALKAIPKDLTEAARMDGATELQVFRRITIPLLWPTITVVATLTMIGVLKIFDLVWTMTQEGPAGASAVLATRMYVESFQNADQGYGSTIAVILLIAVIPVMALNIRRFQAEGPR